MRRGSRRRLLRHKIGLGKGESGLGSPHISSSPPPPPVGSSSAASDLTIPPKQQQQHHLAPAEGPSLNNYTRQHPPRPRPQTATPQPAEAAAPRSFPTTRLRSSHIRRTPAAIVRGGKSDSSSEDIIPEIVVRTDGMEIVDLADNPSPVDSPAHPEPLPKHLLSAMAQEVRPSLTSSLSAMSDDSDLSSLSSISSKATTPVDLDGSKELAPTMDVDAPQSAVTTISPASQPSAEIPQPEIPEPSRPRALSESLQEPRAQTPPTQSKPLPEPILPSLEPQQPRLQDPPPRPEKFKIRQGPRRRYDVRPRLSIPSDLSLPEYAMQCIAAAESSRLNPYALHQDEYLMLRDHISHAQITTYLNIRNGILRLWVRNPDVSVTREEAIGCAKDSRWFDVANVCFDWLAREGFINFGCAEVRLSRKYHVSSSNQGQGEGNKDDKRKTVVVIGAGLAGLGCARNLHSLFAQYAKRFRERDEQPPRIVVLEARNRVGGRVYSRALKTKPAFEPKTYRSTRHSAEMGGMIVTGFERGNPINILIRGQLGLTYHTLRPDTILYDSSGKPVDSNRDQLVEQLYNDCLDRVSEYKFKLPMPKLLEGNRDLINEGKDSSAEVVKTISYVEETTAAQPHALPVSQQNIAPRVDMVPVSSDRVTGRVHVEPGTPGATKAAQKAKLMGWPLKSGVSDDRDINLDSATQQPGATLGSVLDDAIMQYKDIVDLNAQDMRLIGWHIANLEYSNAANQNQLSLKGWDLDMGNEWEGRHTMIIGGYQNLALGLAQYPTPLQIEYKKEVSAIKAVRSRTSVGPNADAAPEPEPEHKPNPELEPCTFTIQCSDGTSVHADYVVNTIPLGVLKHKDVEFQPPLPTWKTDAVGRIGYGVLNKVILVYHEPFWDKDKDIFGVLREPAGGDGNGNANITHPRDHSSQRGRFFQWFNVSHTSGLPTLLALMAGDAAFDTERASNDDLVREATGVLRSVFGPAVPEPAEAVVTRWVSDRFARGSYSSAGPNMRIDDYDLMSRPVGNHFFAGEHTSATHPATVHGAYLTGLRAASEVLGAILGPIEIPTPLIIPKDFSASANLMSSASLLLKRKSSSSSQVVDPRREAEEAHEAKVLAHIRSRLGEYPLEPARVTAKAHLLFGRANFEAAREKCLEGRRPGKPKPTASEVRSMAAKMWNAANEETRRPFVEQLQGLKEEHARAMVEFKVTVAEYNRRAEEVRAGYEREHPRPFSTVGPPASTAAVATAGAVNAAGAASSLSSLSSTPGTPAAAGAASASASAATPTPTPAPTTPAPATPASASAGGGSGAAPSPREGRRRRSGRGAAATTGSSAGKEDSDVEMVDV